MFRLRIGYALTGIATGLVLLFSFLGSLPDGKLHIIFCDVGQGDGAYIRFPDGRDMVVDGGPNDKILGCLGNHMPFWDRQIDIVVMTHPQKDHMQGLLSIFNRYEVGYFVRSDIANSTEGYQKLLELMKEKKISEKFVTAGEQISIGQVGLTVLWPSDKQVARMKNSFNNVAMEQCDNEKCVNVLGSTTAENLNDGSVVFWLRYGSFDALLPGDADNHVNGEFVGTQLADNTVEVLKVPHHGSKTGMSEAFLDWLRPELAVISVGKNSYGHPTREILEMLRERGIQTLRTDEHSDIEIISNGADWELR